MNKNYPPKLVVVAGPNGAGKSTLTSKAYPRLIEETIFINPDEIVKEVEKLYPHDTHVKRMAIAARTALKAYETCFEKKQSFSLETTLAGNTPIKTMKKARERGYHITLAYVGIESPLDSIVRVRERVQQGGHDIPVKDILRRYYRSMNNLPIGISLSDITLIFDNSQTTHQLQLFLEKCYIKEIYILHYPNWLKKIILENTLSVGQKLFI